MSLKIELVTIFMENSVLSCAYKTPTLEHLGQYQKGKGVFFKMAKAGMHPFMLRVPPPGAYQTYQFEALGQYL